MPLQKISLSHAWTSCFDRVTSEPNPEPNVNISHCFLFLAPQVGPTSVSLFSTSPYCVMLGWQPPSYPNGEITGYKYTCTNRSEMTAGSDDREVTVCDYPRAFTPVTCTIEASNEKGDSDEVSEDTTTKCSCELYPAMLVLCHQVDIRGKKSSLRHETIHNTKCRCFWWHYKHLHSLCLTFKARLYGTVKLQILPPVIQRTWTLTFFLSRWRSSRSSLK